MTIYFIVPSDLQIINRLVEILNVGNEYTYEASKGLVSISSKNITREKIQQLAEYIRTPNKTKVEESCPINYGTFNVETNLKNKYKNTPVICKITKTEINYEKGTITSYADISTKNVSDVIADILSTAVFEDEPLAIPSYMKDLANKAGISESELAEAAQAFNELIELLQPSKNNNNNKH